MISRHSLNIISQVRQKILESHANVKDLNLLEAKMNFIRAWQSLPEYGVSLFVVRYRFYLSIYPAIQLCIQLSIYVSLSVPGRAFQSMESAFLLSGIYLSSYISSYLFIYLYPCLAEPSRILSQPFCCQVSIYLAIYISLLVPDGYLISLFIGSGVPLSIYISSYLSI